MRASLLMFLPLVAVGAVPLATVAFVGASGDVGDPESGIRDRSERNGSQMWAGLGIPIGSAGAAGPEWLSYSVPAGSADRFVCCAGVNGAQRVCRPEDGEDGWSMSSDSLGPQSGRDRLRILLGVDHGKVVRVQAYSLGCRVELVWPVTELTAVGAADSVALLRGLAVSAAARERGMMEQALGALGQHAGSAAHEALVALTGDEHPLELRRSAIFWIGQRQTPEAVTALSMLFDRERSPKLREHVLFSLSQTGLDAAVVFLREAAQRDASPEVRKQGWFWLAQTADPRAAAWIRLALTDDPNPEVREGAVFALSQLPDDQSTDQLLQVLRETKEPRLQRQALFWLAQSDDPRALDRIAKILE